MLTVLQGPCSSYLNSAPYEDLRRQVGRWGAGHLKVHRPGYPCLLCRGLPCLYAPGVCSLEYSIEVIDHYKHLRNEDWDPQNMAGQDSILPPKTARYNRVRKPPFTVPLTTTAGGWGFRGHKVGNTQPRPRPGHCKTHRLNSPNGAERNVATVSWECDREKGLFSRAAPIAGQPSLIPIPVP